MGQFETKCPHIVYDLNSILIKGEWWVIGGFRIDYYRAHFIFGPVSVCIEYYPQNCNIPSKSAGCFRITHPNLITITLLHETSRRLGEETFKVLYVDPNDIMVWADIRNNEINKIYLFSRSKTIKRSLIPIIIQHLLAQGIDPNLILIPRENVV
jgi:hypothetical protein